MNNRWTVAMTTLVVFAIADLAVPAAAVAQKKGQAVTIHQGWVVGMKQVQTQSAKGSGAMVGGTIGLITGGSSGKRRRRNAAVGATVGAAASPAES